MAYTRMLLPLTALLGGLFSVPAMAETTPQEAVVAVRHFEVPAPRTSELVINRARPAYAAPVTRPGQPAKAGATGVPESIVPTASAGPSFSLDQPGLPAAARESAPRAGAIQMTAPVTVGTAPATPVPRQAAAAEEQTPAPPAPVFQTMKQAASALPAPAIPVRQAPLEATEAPSMWSRVVAFIKAKPLVVPVGVAAIVALLVLFRRQSAGRRINAADE